MTPIAWAALAALLVLEAALQQSAFAASIFSCIDGRGRRLTSDRPIPECLDREQRQLNQDGSVRATVAPSLTADERAERDAVERKAMQERAARADAVRRDRILMVRYPNQAAHDRARESALQPVLMAGRTSEQRLKSLAAERSRLDAERESYRGQAMPAKLKQGLDAVEAQMAAQQAAGRTQTAERDRINALYDAELARLKQLWAGAEPGSLPAQAEAPQNGLPTRPASGAARR